MQHSEPIDTYSMSFTSGTLLLGESRIIAQAYVEHGAWSPARADVVENNRIQMRTANALRRIWSETAGRLQTLTPAQLALVASNHPDETRLILWLAFCKRYRFVYDFSAEIIHPRFEQMQYDLPHTVWDSYFHHKAEWHPEVARVAAGTRRKQRQVVYKTLREAGLLADGQIQPAILPPAVVRAIVEENADHLYIYPVHPANIVPIA